MKLIAFVGLKQSGKSTACAYLESKLPDTVRVNFKDALIREITLNFPFLLEHLAEKYKCDIKTLFDKKPPEVRKLMQDWGSFRRGHYIDYWVKEWGEQLKGKLCVTTDDCRYPNEAAAIKRLGGILIRLDRTDMTNTDTHSSETEQVNIVCDHTITCSKGEHEKLYKALDDILGL